MAQGKSMRDIATSARRTGDVRRTERGGSFTPAPVNLNQTNIESEKKLTSFERDLEKLGVGAKQAIGAVYETSVYADKIRSNDTYTNFIAGMQNIDKFYSDKMAKGGRLTSKDLADKKDWQNRFHQSMIDQAISAGDDTNQIFKTSFIDPSTEFLMKTNAGDTQNQFNAIKFETKERNSNAVTKLGIQIRGDNFKQFLSDGKRLGIGNYGETISADVANAHNAEIVAGEINAVVAQTTMRGLVDKYAPNALSYDEKTGQFSRGEGFEELSDEAYKSMIQALNVQLNKNTASLTGAGSYDDTPYNSAYGKVKKKIDTHQFITDGDIEDVKKEDASLRANSAFTTNGVKTAGRKRVGVLNENAKAIKVHNDKMTEMQGFFDANGGLLDASSLMARAGEGTLTETMDGNIIDTKFVEGVIEQKSSSIENSLGGMNFNIDDSEKLKKQLGQVDLKLSALWKNEGYRAGGSSPMFKRFDDEQKNPKGNMKPNELLIYSRYLAKRDMFDGKVSDNVDINVQRIMEEKDVPLLQKVKAANSKLQSSAIMRNNEINRASRMNVIKDSVTDHLQSIWKWDSEPIDGTAAVFNQILPNASKATLEAEIEGRDAVRIGKIGIGTRRGDYIGAILWKGGKEKRARSFIEKAVADFNKGKVDEIDEDDLDVFPRAVHTDNGRDIAYDIHIMVGGKQMGKPILMSKQTVEKTFGIYIPDEDEKESNVDLSIMF